MKTSLLNPLSLSQQILLCFALLVFYFKSNAQNNWTWVNGSSNNQSMAPVYGTQGVGSSANTPGNRENAVTWTDSNGDFWLYGGYNSVNSIMGDLWKYHPATNEWTWMKGPSGSGGNGVYGTQGVPAPTNRPGGRIWAGGWADHSGNLWLFGGYGNSATSSLIYMNDMWKYSIATNEWTWMKGSNVGYVVCSPGTQSVSSPSNDPGSRYYFSTATDFYGNLWLFGGLTYLPTNNIPLNDLWKYNTSTNEWTWMKGTPTATVPGIYGTMGSPAPANVPGSRFQAAMVSDNTSYLYLFSGIAPNFLNGTNDLWRYDLSSGEWTWLKGSSGASSPASYGTMGLSASSNMPPSRTMWGSTSYFLDGTGNFWIFGGISGTTTYFNDLWRYRIANNEWTWMKGSSLSNQTGIYGTQGVAAPANNPGGRYAQAGWKEGEKLWVYGGNGYNASSQGFLNDLWKLDLCDAPNPPVTSTVIVPGSICTGSSAILSTYSDFGGILWYATPSSTTSLYNGSNFQTPTLSALGSSSVYTYYAEAFYAGCKSYSRTAVSVTVYPQPVLSAVPVSPTICAGETASINLSGGQSYTCMAASVNFILSSGTWTLMPEESFTYTLIGASQHGCLDTISFKQTIDPCTGIWEHYDNTGFSIYPNPHKEEFVIRTNEAEDCSIEILTIAGQLVLKKKLLSPVQVINTQPLAKGVYYLKLMGKDRTTEVQKIVKSD